MRRTLGRAVLAASIGCALVACNALTGVADLGACGGDDDCATLGSAEAIDGGGGDGSMSVTPPRVDSGDPVLPTSCTGNEPACTGNIAAQCVKGDWQKTTCAQTCVAGKCDAELLVSQRQAIAHHSRRSTR